MTDLNQNKTNRRPGRLPVMTLTLIGLNLAVFLILRADPLLERRLILDPAGFQSVPWTMLTVVFVHDNPLQLAANMVILFFAGRSLEHEAAPLDVIASYLLCGASGSFMSLLYISLAEPVRLIPGASAAVFGMTAVYAALRSDKIVLGRSLMHWVIFFLIYTAVALVISPIPPAGGPAHAGGILAGIVLGRYLNGRSARAR